MGPHLQKLVSIAGPPLSSERARLSRRLQQLAGSADELAELLRARNGFFAFESALHVFPAGGGNDSIDLEAWNSSELWRQEYGGHADAMLFFSEDVFGFQFVIKDGRILRFEPETAQLEAMAEDLDTWARTILEDYWAETGYQIAHEWQRANGPLPPGQRLVAKIPFILGGDWSVDNVRAMDAVEAMRFRGALASQLHDLPDGTRVQIEIVD